MTTLTTILPYILAAPTLTSVGDTLDRVAAGLVAGWRAAIDLRRLEARSDAALTREASRDMSCRALHERHFGL